MTGVNYVGISTTIAAWIDEQVRQRAKDKGAASDDEHDTKKNALPILPAHQSYLLMRTFYRLDLQSQASQVKQAKQDKQQKPYHSKRTVTKAMYREAKHYKREYGDKYESFKKSTYEPQLPGPYKNAARLVKMGWLEFVGSHQRLHRITELGQEKMEQLMSAHHEMIILDDDAAADDDDDYTIDLASVKKPEEGASDTDVSDGDDNKGTQDEDNEVELAKAMSLAPTADVDPKWKVLAQEENDLENAKRESLMINFKSDDDDDDDDEKKNTGDAVHSPSKRRYCRSPNRDDRICSPEHV